MESAEDTSTFSLIELTLSGEQFQQFQQELNDLMLKYYKMDSSNENAETKTIAVNIIPKPQ